MPASRDSLIDYFHDIASAHAQFLVHDDGFRTRSYSYAEVGRAARGFAARLSDAGVHKGDKVMFWSKNRPEWVVAFWRMAHGASRTCSSDLRIADAIEGAEYGALTKEVEDAVRALG